MASYSLANVPPHTFPRTSSLSSHFSPSILSFRICRHVSSLVHTRVCALNTGSDADGLVKKPVGSTGEGISGILGGDKGGSVKMAFEEDSENERWVDWEDQILEDTVPLVSFVRMLLHSGKYESGERLIPEHESTILEKLLPFHPEFEKKKGCGIDHITIGYHPNFERSRCLFIVRTDGELVDFSYWKCIKGLIRKNYPLYADSFILRHFRRRRRNY